MKASKVQKHTCLVIFLYKICNDINDHCYVGELYMELLKTPVKLGKSSSAHHVQMGAKAP